MRLSVSLEKRRGTGNLHISPSACSISYTGLGWSGYDRNQIYPVGDKQHVSVNLDHKITVEYDQPIMARVFRVILKKIVFII